jgi:hypothetical protein
VPPKLSFGEYECEVESCTQLVHQRISEIRQSKEKRVCAVGEEVGVLQCWEQAHRTCPHRNVSMAPDLGAWAQLAEATLDRDRTPDGDGAIVWQPEPEI